MAVDFAKVKAITIPEGTVKSISINGTTVWNDTDWKPYRKLQYIYCNGTTGIDLGYKPGSDGNQGVLTAKIALTKTNKSNPTSSYFFVMGAIQADSGSTKGSNFYQYATINLSDDSTTVANHFLGKESTTRYPGSSSNNAYNTTITKGTQYRFRLRGTTTSSMYANIQDASGSNISGTNQDYTSETYSPSYFSNVWLMKFPGLNSSLSTHRAQDNAIGRIYAVTKQVGAANTAYQNQWYPAQRKSDNVCGLYDQVNDVFYPLSGSGTAITTTAAGPTVQENYR